MNSALLQMALLMGCGVGWRLLEPGGLAAAQTRWVLTSVVYFLLLPAMVLDVLWAADIGIRSLQYTLLGISSIAFCMCCMWAIGKFCRFDERQLGALLLAVFPNVTYLGLPVLEQIFGDWARSVVIQMDLFACAPFLFTIGLMIVRRYGDETDNPHKPVLSYLNAPPFWAAAAAIILSACGLKPWDWLSGTLQKLSAAVVPLMVFSLGLALDWRAMAWRNIPYVILAIIIKLLVMPMFALVLATPLDLDIHHKAAAVLDLAMPSMILGIVFCDRYRLDSGLYAMTVTVTTALSLATLPFWYDWIYHWLRL